MAGIGRKIGGATPNNQIKNAEAQMASNNQQQAQVQQSVKPQAQQQVQQAVQQAQQTQKQQTVQNPALSAILTQLKNIATTLTQIKNINSTAQKDAAKAGRGSLTTQQVELGPATIANLTRSFAAENLDEIKQRLLRIDNALSKSSSLETSTDNTQLNAFSNAISEFTSKLSGWDKNPSGSGASAAEYNIKIDTTNIENAFNNFATRLEEIVGMHRESRADIDRSIIDSSEGITEEYKKETHELLFSINENIIKLNQGLDILQKTFNNINNKTQRFYSAANANWNYQKFYDIGDTLVESNRHNKLIETLNENTAKQIASAEKIINEKNDPVTRLNKAISDLKASRERQDEIEKTNMGADRNPNNNLFNAVDNWLLNKAKAGTNYLMGGGIVKYVNRKKAEHAEKKAIKDIRSAEADMLVSTKNDSDDVVLEMQQDRTAIPDRPNASLATQDQMVSKKESTGVMAPSNGLLSRAFDTVTNAIMLRNSAINNFAESKEGKRSGQTASTMKATDPVLAKLEAQLVQLTLIRAALTQQVKDQRKAAREAELQEAFEEGSEDDDNSIQLVPIEKETEKGKPEKDEKKEGNGLFGLIMSGLGALLLGKSGFLGGILNFLSGTGMNLLGGLLNFSLKGLWTLVTNWLPGGLKLLWKAGSFLFKPLGGLLKFLGGTAWNFIKTGFSGLLNFITKGPLGKLMGGLFKGGGKLIGGLVSKIMPIAGPVAAAAGVALIGWQVGKMLGNWLELDKKIGKLLGLDEAEKANEEHAAKMKEMSDERVKNIEIARMSFADRTKAIEEREKKGEALSATDKIFLAASKDEAAKASRASNVSYIVNRFKETKEEDLSKEDATAMIGFLDESIKQVEDEFLNNFKTVGSTIEEQAKKTKKTSLLYNQEFIRLCKAGTLQATNQALSMLQKEKERLNKLQREATFLTSASYDTDLSALAIVESKLTKQRGLLLEKDRYEKSKENIEKMKETLKEKPKPKPTPPPETVKAPSKDEENEKPVPLVDVNTGIEEHEIPKNESNVNAELTKDKMVDGSSTYVDPNKLTDEEKENLIKSLELGDSADNGLFGNMFRNYVQTSIALQQKAYGKHWYEKGDYPKFFTYFRQEWLKNFYENGKVLRWKEDQSGVESLDKAEYAKAALDANLVRVLDTTPEVKQNKILDEEVEPMVIPAESVDESMTNEDRMEFNKAEEERYNTDLEAYETAKKEFNDKKENATIENDETLKEAYLSYIKYMANNEALGGSPESRKQLGKENWLKTYKNGVVLIGADNGSVAMTKDEFFAKYYDQPQPPPPPTFYELMEPDSVESGEQLSDQELAQQQEEQLLAENAESGENNESVKTAINSAKDAAAQAAAGKEQSTTESAKAATQAAAAAASLAAQTAALTNPKSPDSIKNAIITAMKTANENKEVVVYQNRRADNVMVKAEA